jgi:hypothetical protein
MGTAQNAWSTTSRRNEYESKVLLWHNMDQNHKSMSLAGKPLLKLNGPSAVTFCNRLRRAWSLTITYPSYPLQSWTSSYSEHRSGMTDAICIVTQLKKHHSFFGRQANESERYRFISSPSWFRFTVSSWVVHKHKSWTICSLSRSQTGDRCTRLALVASNL